MRKTVVFLLVAAVCFPVALLLGGCENIRRGLYEGSQQYRRSNRTPAEQDKVKEPTWEEYEKERKPK